jgi:hypothetical protein
VAADYPGGRPQFPDFRLLAGIGLAGITVDWLFAHLQPTLVAYLVFIGGVLCPLAWLLGQTVPILTNLMQAERTGEASGMALYWSTLGSFLGSLTLSLIVMQWLGVSAAVFACAAILAWHPAPRRADSGRLAALAWAWPWPPASTPTMRSPPTPPTPTT